MKNTNEFINESVFRVNLKYAQMQNKTKELFFKCLNENKDLDDFKKGLEKIWGNLDHTFLQDELLEYEEIIHEQNLKGKTKKEIEESFVPVASLISLGIILNVEEKFKKIKEREYKNSTKSYAYQRNKEEYLKMKVKRYNNQIVPYEVHEYVNGKKTNKVIGYRYVQMSTYNAMIHNTNLTRAGWDTTLNDADYLGYKYFYIPYHPFSCQHCIDHQNKLYTRDDVLIMVGYLAEEIEGDILHPNCKCKLVAIKDEKEFDNIESPFNYQFTREEKINISKIRQKVNGLTLKKEELLTDIRIQKSLGNYDQVDTLNQQRNKINASIRELKEALPTAELQRQVVAINR